MREGCKLYAILASLIRSGQCRVDDRTGSPAFKCRYGNSVRVASDKITACETSGNKFADAKRACAGEFGACCDPIRHGRASCRAGVS